jgi:heme-degrading monooxygenase HmoA
MYMLLIDGKIAPGKKDEFLKAWGSRILPLLKKENGFVDEVLLFDPATQSQAVGLCFWNTKEQAERYQREVFPLAKGFVEHLIEGAPTLRGFEVEASETFGIGAKAA